MNFHKLTLLLSVSILFSPSASSNDAEEQWIVAAKFWNAVLIGDSEEANKYCFYCNSTAEILGRIGLRYPIQIGESTAPKQLETTLFEWRKSGYRKMLSFDTALLESDGAWYVDDTSTIENYRYSLLTSTAGLTGPNVKTNKPKTKVKKKDFDPNIIPFKFSKNETGDGVEVSIDIAQDIYIYLESITFTDSSGSSLDDGIYIEGSIEVSSDEFRGKTLIMQNRIRIKVNSDIIQSHDDITISFFSASKAYGIAFARSDFKI